MNLSIFLYFFIFEVNYLFSPMRRSSLSIQEIPSLRFIVPLVFGILIYYYFFRCHSFIFSIGAVVCLIVIVQSRFSTFIYNISGFICFFFLICVGFIYSFLRDDINSYTHFSKIVESDVSKNHNLFCVDITEPIVKKNFYRSVLNIQSIYLAGKWVNCSGKIQAFIKDSNNLDYFKVGNRLVINAKLNVPQSPANPLSFDYRKYLDLKHINFTTFLESENIILESTPFFNLFQFTNECRMKLIKRTNEIIGVSEFSDLSNAVLLGYKDEIDEATFESFLNTGAMHLLAVSGMHVLLIYKNILGLIRISRLDRIVSYKFVNYFSLILIWFFGFIVGMQSSILRAVIMITLVIIGKTFKNTAHSLNLCFCVFLVMCILDPFIIWDVGFQLSFAAVLGILILAKPIKAKLPNFISKRSTISEMISLTIAAQIGTLPFVLYYFHQFPLYFLLTSLVAVFISDGVIIVGFCTLFISCFSLQFAQYIGIIWKFLLKMLLYSIDIINNMPNVVMSKIYFSWTMAIILCVLLLLIFIRQFVSIPLFRFKIFVLFVFVLIIDLVHFFKNRDTNLLTVYSSNKGRIFEVQNSYNSFLYADTTLNEKQIKFITENWQIENSIRKTIISPLIPSSNYEFETEKNKFYLPVKQVNVDKINNFPMILPPNDNYSLKCTERILQFSSLESSQKNVCQNYYNLKNKAFVKILN